MIVDIHTHIGLKNYGMTPEMLILSMQNHGISAAFVSDLDLGGCGTADYLAGSERLFALAGEHPDKIGVFLWCSPYADFGEIKKLFLKHRKYIYGLKCHPAIERVAFDDERFYPFYRLAAEHGLPVLTHCASDTFSLPARTAAVAEKFPHTDFILGHMGLGTDHKEALSFLIRYPNVYGDTAWVKPDSVAEIIRLAGENKLIFGTDNPINGAETYNDTEYYTCYFANTPPVSGKALSRLLYQNALKLTGFYLAEKE